MSDKPEDIKAPAAEEHEAAHQLLQCVRQDIPKANEFDPGAVSDRVYQPGKSGDDYLAGRVFNHEHEKNPPGGVGLYELKMNGKTYVDFIQPNDSSAPGKDTVSWFKTLKIGEKGHVVKEGTAEYDKVVNSIHKGNLFDGCEKLP